MKAKFVVALIALVSVSTARAETASVSLIGLSQQISDEVKDSVIGNSELADAQRDLLKLKGRLLVAQIGRGLPVVAGVTTGTITVLNTIGARIGTKTISTGMSVMSEGTASRIASFGRKYSKFIFVTGIATTTSMIHWYLLADDQVERFLAEVETAEQTVTRLIAAREVLASQPTP